MVWDVWRSFSIWLTKMTGGWLTFACCLRWSERVNDSKQSLQTCFRSPVWHLNDLSVYDFKNKCSDFVSILETTQTTTSNASAVDRFWQTTFHNSATCIQKDDSFDGNFWTWVLHFCITFSKVMAEIPYVGLQMRRLLIRFPTIFVMTFVADYLNTWIPSIQLSKRKYPVFSQTYENYRNTQLGHLHLTQILLWNVVEDWGELDEVESTMDVDWDGVESSQGRKYLNCSGIAPCEVQFYWMTCRGDEE